MFNVAKCDVLCARSLMPILNSPYFQLQLSKANVSYISILVYQYVCEIKIHYNLLNKLKRIYPKNKLYFINSVTYRLMFLSTGMCQARGSVIINFKTCLVFEIIFLCDLAGYKHWLFKGLVY